VIEGLRERIRKLERSGEPSSGQPAERMTGQHSGPHRAQRWDLGVGAFDSQLGETGIDPAAVHEIKPLAFDGGSASAGCVASARLFALGLAVRRLNGLAMDGLAMARHQRRGAADTCGEGLRHSSAALASARLASAGFGDLPPIVWCSRLHDQQELGGVCGAGLAAMGLDPSRILFVRGRRDSDVLWAIEEAIASGAAPIVIGETRDVALTPARRLSLAARSAQVPCLIVSDPRSPGIAATMTRWRIGPAAPHSPSFTAAVERYPCVSERVGMAGLSGPRFSARIERCRNVGASVSHEPVRLEWCDEALRFDLVSELADAAAGPGRTGGRSTGQADGAGPGGRAWRQTCGC